MSTVLAAEDILIRTLPTPNPSALKFVTNVPLKREGKATFYSTAECSELPLMRDVLELLGVKQVHVFQNTMTVTHVGDLDNDSLSDAVQAVLRSRYPVHNPDFGVAAAPVRTARPPSEDPRLVEIEEILDRTIRPGLQADGGDLEVRGLNGDELQIFYQGACGGCPSAMMGTLDAIQGILRAELGHEALTVRVVED